MFDKLPLEIVDMIASHLSSKDLFHLISTSRTLYSFLLGRLYAEVTLYGRRGSLRGGQSFLYAVTRNPRLAGCVRTLRLGEWDNLFWMTAGGSIEVDKKLLSRLLSERKEYSEKEKSKWLEDLKKGKRSDPWIALIIPQLKEMRKFGITVGEYSRSGYVFDMLRRLSENPESAFPRLREVYACWNGRQGSGMPSYYMHSLFKFPSVQKLGCHFMRVVGDGQDDGSDVESDDDNQSWRRRLSPRSSNITDIDVSYSDAPTQDWIPACKALRSFRMLDVLESPGHEFQAREIQKSLSLHKSTLECLSVSVVSEAAWEDNRDNDWMGTFVDFTALKFICCRFTNLVYFDESNRPRRKLRNVLPNSLETLCLIFDDGANFHAFDIIFMKAMVQLVKLAKAEDFPNLTAIHIVHPRIKSSKTMARLEWSEQECKEAGKSFFAHSLADRSFENVWNSEEAFIPLGDDKPMGEAWDLGCL